MNRNKKYSYEEALEILSERETEILDLAGRGYTNKKIASKLNITVRTVQTHRNAICNKLGVHGRGKLKKWYMESKSFENKNCR